MKSTIKKVKNAKVVHEVEKPILSDILVTRNNSEIKSIEEAYSIANSEHTIGTNLYTFKFNHQWRNKQIPLKIAIRKINLNFSPRIFQVNGLSISNGTQNNTFNISPFVMITESMTQTNKSFQKDIKEFQEYDSDIPKGIYSIYYNPANKKLVFEITTTDNYYFIIDPNVSVSDDFKYITGKNNFTDGTIIKDLNNKIKRIVFDNVWDRENIYVQASFVDLAYGNYLGVTNDSYYPPKEYPITFGDQKFWIRLYDSFGNEIELPNDGKDNLIIESIMTTY